jgi:hypothetical protein
LRGARRLTYADSRMKNLLTTLLHFAVVTAKLCGPGGVRAVIAENLVLKQQLIVLRRGRHRAPNLALSDRLICGLAALFLSVLSGISAEPSAGAVEARTGRLGS